MFMFKLDFKRNLFAYQLIFYIQYECYLNDFTNDAIIFAMQ